MSGFEDLERNICDVVFEDQIKLGYRSEVIRLYYPLASLNRLMGKECTRQQMAGVLEEFSHIAAGRLGAVEVTNRGDQFCLRIPPEGADYVHSTRDENDFLVKFIEAISSHNCGIEDIINIFRQYSDRIFVGKMENEEFDYLLYFEDGKPNDYRYCVALEGCHATYHRFTPGDYEEFGFGEVVPLA